MTTATARTTSKKLPVAAQKAIARIALECGFETLEERRSDRLDFHEVAVWRMRAALEAAYLEGVEQTMKRVFAS